MSVSLLSRTRPLALFAATAALLAGLTGQPAAAADEPTMTRLTLDGDLFRMTDTNSVTAATTLAGRLADADLTDVVTTEYPTDSTGAADPGMRLGSMRACAGDETKALPPVDRKISWCWSSELGDDTTPRWWPQGMSSTGVADGADGAIQGKSVTAVAWHYKTFRTDAAGTLEANDKCRTNNLLRLSFIDRDTLKYRHVLLAEPTSGGQNFKYVTGHGGGVVWYANHLYYRTLVQGSTLQGGGVGHPEPSGPEGRSGIAKVALSDNVVGGPTAGLAGRQACGDLVRPPSGGRGR